MPKFSLTNFSLTKWIAAGAVLLALQGAAFAGEVLDRVKAAGVIRVATDPAWPPYSWKTADGQWQGFDASVAQEIAKRLGVKIEFVTPSWDVITSGDWKGKWDLSVGSMSPTEDRAKVLDISGSLLLFADGSCSEQGQQGHPHTWGCVRQARRRAEGLDLREVPPPPADGHGRRDTAGLQDQRCRHRHLRNLGSRFQGPGQGWRHRRHGRRHDVLPVPHQGWRARPDRGAAAILWTATPSPSSRATKNSRRCSTTRSARCMTTERCRPCPTNGSASTSRTSSKEHWSPAT